MDEITTNNELVVGKYYHCFNKRFGSHEIHKCGAESGGTKYLGNNHIWADDNNKQALEKWKIIGPIEIPKIKTIFLCKKHGGYGFISDCAACNHQPT